MQKANNKRNQVILTHKRSVQCNAMGSYLEAPLSSDYYGDSSLYSGILPCHAPSVIAELDDNWYYTSYRRYYEIDLRDIATYDHINFTLCDSRDNNAEFGLSVWSHDVRNNNWSLLAHTSTGCSDDANALPLLITRDTCNDVTIPSRILTMMGTTSTRST